jgi:GTP pyrophosphokinase
MKIGERIADLRKAQNMTQEKLAELVGVTPQAVSKWENNWTQPDNDKLASIARHLNTTVPSLLWEDSSLPPWVLRDRMFSEDSMFTRMRTFAQTEGLQETNKALYYARTMHSTQTRKKGVLGKTDVPYIIHPLMAALHAHALGLKDDVLLAATLLHDVCEECDVSPLELPFSREVQEIVGLLTYEKPQSGPEDSAKTVYYERIAKNGKAAVIKALDRCSNVSTMAHSFSQEKLIRYIEETERYVLPLLQTIKENYLEYNDAYFILYYHILSVIESLKNMLERGGA